MTWEQALQFATNPVGVGTIVGLILSWTATYVPAYQPLEAKAKRLIFLAACLIVPIVASLLVAATGIARLTWDPLLWAAIQTGITAFGAGTLLNTRSLPNKAESDAYAIWHARFVAGE